MLLRRVRGNACSSKVVVHRNGGRADGSIEDCGNAGKVKRAVCGDDTDSGLGWKIGFETSGLPGKESVKDG